MHRRSLSAENGGQGRVGRNDIVGHTYYRQQASARSFLAVQGGMPDPGHPGARSAVGRAVHPRCVGLEEHLDGPQVQAAPPSRPSPGSYYAALAPHRPQRPRTAR